MTKITLSMLEKKGACFSARMDFRRLFGEEVEVTEENVRKIFESKCMVANYTWAAGELLSSQGYTRWTRMRSPKHSDGAFVDDYDGVKPCPGCLGQWLNFVKVYNEEKADEELFTD